MSALLALEGSSTPAFGALLGTALTVSAATGRAFSLSAIRAGDTRPGLRPAHTALVRAAALGCQARLSGVFDGSPELRFEPGAPASGAFHFELPEGAAVAPLVECLTPILARSEAACSLELVGATHLPQAPLPEFLEHHWLVLVGRLGLDARLVLQRAAFTPAGGGLLALGVRPSRPPQAALQLEERGALLGLAGLSVVGKLGRALAERQAQAFTRWLWEQRRLEAPCRIVELPAASPGAALYVEARFENGRGAFAQLGQKGEAPESLGERLARRLLRFVEEQEGALDALAAERLAVPLALTPAGGRLGTCELTAELQTTCATLRRFGLRAETWGRLGGPGGCETRAVLTPAGATASIARSALTLALLGLVACAGAPRPIETIPTRPLRTATLDEVLAAYDAYAQGMQTLSASGDLEVRDRRRGQARRFGMRLLAGRGGRLYIKASVAVVTALEVVADGHDFWFQVPSKKTVWSGPAASRPVLSGTREPYEALRPADILAALLPDPLEPAPGETLVLESDRETFSLLVARTGAGRASARRRVWLERESLQPSRLRSYDESGEVELDVALQAWREGLPRRIEVARPLDGYEARFDLDKLRTNVPLPAAAFAPRTPAGYEVVKVE